MQQAKELVRQRIDLVSLVGEVVPLKRSGRSFKGLCPFHEEKTPSFHVHPESQIFRCYGCGEGGDLFAFVMKREGIGFREALEELAERAGVDLPRGGGGARRGPAKQQYLEVLARAQAFFAARLRAPEGAEAMRYVEGRGLEAALVPFGLGHAPGPSEAPGGGRHWPLVAELGRAGVPLPLAAELGLVGRTERGQWYDRFRNRLTFPIHDGQGRIVGFGGRILPGHEGEREPKYLNSPESPVFNKRSLLFGLAKARQARARRLVVMEGYTDVIACHLAGIPEAVATLGTSLTREHAALIRRYAPDGTVLLFDGDEAGRRAAERAYAALSAETLPARICLLEGGKDPADLARAEGREGIERVLDGARDALEVWIELLSARHDPSRHEGKVAVAEA
ncbi:MAG: DNA primase, partial [Planctomycetota bacterium]